VRKETRGRDSERRGRNWVGGRQRGTEVRGEGESDSRGERGEEERGKRGERSERQGVGGERKEGERETREGETEFEKRER